MCHHYCTVKITFPFTWLYTQWNVLKFFQIKFNGCLSMWQADLLSYCTPHPFSDFVTPPSHNESIHFSCISYLIKWNFNLRNIGRLSRQLSSHGAMPRTAWARYLVMYKFITSIEKLHLLWAPSLLWMNTLRKNNPLLEGLTALIVQNMWKSQQRLNPKSLTGGKKSTLWLLPRPENCQRWSVRWKICFSGSKRWILRWKVNLFSIHTF